MRKTTKWHKKRQVNVEISLMKKLTWRDIISYYINLEMYDKLN